MLFYPRGVFAGLIAISLLCPCTVYGWGERAHGVINRAAIDALPDDGPVYLKAQEALIARSATLPDTWRAESEAFSKMEEDPNHGWFREQFAFITTIPRSRIAFLLSLYREHERLARSDPGTAQRMNIRWTGTLPYAVLEGYGRLVADMRLIRALRLKGVDTTPFETDTAFLVAWMGHYIADGSQPLHVTVHHDGWVGPNPAHYTRDPAVHGRFETDYVNLIGLSESDIVPYLAPVAHQHSDVFTAVLAYLDRSHRDVETVYRLDRDGALHDAGNREARSLVYERCAAASAMLRDLVTRAWKESGLSPLPPTHPDDPDNPGYDPATGSAPAPLSRKLPEPVRHAVP